MHADRREHACGLDLDTGIYRREVKQVNVEVPFTANDRKRLIQPLGASRDPDEVAEFGARAGTTELLTLATGRVVPAKLAEARGFRIFNLIDPPAGG